MRRLIASVGIAGLMLAGAASPALAKKPSHNAQAERLCERNDGTFIDLDGIAYVCLLATGATAREVEQAGRLCKRQGGALFVGVGNLAYACVLPGHTIVDLPPTLPGGVDVGGLLLVPILVL